jgi:hypothetical protein
LVRHRVTVGSVRRVLRRSLTILLPLSIAVVATGCTTFSDSDAVARVGDVELTRDEFDATLTELGVTGDDAIPLDPVRAEITRWINEQLVAEIDVPALYDAGATSSGIACISAIVVEEEATADAALADLEGGADFVEVFTENNVDQSLVATNGDIPCLSPDDIANNAASTPFVAVAATMSPDEPFATAPLLDTTGAEFAWVVISFRSFDDLADPEVEQLAGVIDVSAAAADADIHVDARYGTYDRDTGTVVGLG